MFSMEFWLHIKSKWHSPRAQLTFDEGEEFIRHVVYGPAFQHFTLAGSGRLTLRWQKNEKDGLDFLVEGNIDGLVGHEFSLDGEAIAGLVEFMTLPGDPRPPVWEYTKPNASTLTDDSSPVEVVTDAPVIGFSHQHDAIVLKDKEEHGNGTVTLYTIRISADGIIGHAEDYKGGYSVSDIYDLTEAECQQYIDDKVPAALIERITGKSSSPVV